VKTLLEIDLSQNPHGSGFVFLYITRF